MKMFLLTVLKAPSLWAQSRIHLSRPCAFFTLKNRGATTHFFLDLRDAHFFSIFASHSGFFDRDLLKFVQAFPEKEF